MLPASDVKFLQHVVRHLSERRLHVYAPGAHRAAVALILRFGDTDQKALSSLLRVLLAEQRHNAEFEERFGDGSRWDRRGLLGQFVVHNNATTTRTSPTLLDRETQATRRAIEELTLHVDITLTSSLRLLFMKRKDVSTDRWSGQISFPGGLRDPEDADDLHTVSRGVHEGLGIPLHSPEFLCLGRLPDYQMKSRVISAEGLVQARFVFLHVGDMTPSVRIADHEVDSVRWMPLARLQPQYVLPHSVVHPLSGFVQTRDADKRLVLTELFPNALIAFPSVSMPPTPAEQAEEEGGTATQQRLPPWRVWGLTLRSASELLMLDDRPVLDWPLLSSNSALVQRVGIDAFHGYYETQLLWYRAAAWVRFCVLQRGKGQDPQTDTREAATGKEANAKGSGEEKGNEKEAEQEMEEEERRRLRQRYRDYHHGGALQRRRAILPVSAPSLLYAVPDSVNSTHVLSFLVDVGLAVCLVYCFAALVYVAFAAFRTALGLEEGSAERRAAEERRRRYYEEKIPLSVAKARHHRPTLDAQAQDKENGEGSPAPLGEGSGEGAGPLSTESMPHSATRKPLARESAANSRDLVRLSTTDLSLSSSLPLLPSSSSATADVDGEEERQHRHWWGGLAGKSTSPTSTHQHDSNAEKTEQQQQQQQHTEKVEVDRETAPKGDLPSTMAAASQPFEKGHGEDADPVLLEEYNQAEDVEEVLRRYRKEELS